MALLFLLTLSALTCLRVSEAGAAQPKIPGANPRYATVGSNITFTCVLSDNHTDDPFVTVRWFFNDQTVTNCGATFTDFIIWNDTQKACSLTIDPVMETSGGLYLCQAFPNKEGLQKFQATVQLDVIDATLHLLDPATGAVLDDPEYGPVCVQSDTTRRFECSIQDARPGVWTFKWILGNQTITTKGQARSGGAGLVNVSSWHIVTNPGNETRERNLTCLATSSDQSLSTRVLITFCAEPEYVKTVLRVLVSICVTATIATIITHILLCKYYGYI